MIKQTIRQYLALTFLTKLGNSFIVSTYALFLISKGLNLFEANLVNLVFFVTLALCEMPTGAVADVFGRKFSFVLSCLLYSLGTFIYAGSNSFWGFALAEATAAVGSTLASGAFQAWLVDRLKHYGWEGSLNTIFSREQQFGQAGVILGAILGAFIADINIALPWFTMGVVMFMNGLIANIWLKEEYFVRRLLSFAGGLREMKKTLVASVDYGMKNRVVRFIFTLGTIQFLAVQAPNMQWQPFFVGFLSGRTGLGFIFAGIALAIALGAWFAPCFLRQFKSEERSLLFSQILIGVGLVAAALCGRFPAALAAFLFHEMARGVFRPLKDVYLNDNIPSKERATLISFEALSHHVGGVVGLLASGFMAQHISIPFTWIFFGAFLVFSGFWFLRKNKPPI